MMHLQNFWSRKFTSIIRTQPKRRMVTWPKWNSCSSLERSQKIWVKLSNKCARFRIKPSRIRARTNWAQMQAQAKLMSISMEMIHMDPLHQENSWVQRVKFSNRILKASKMVCSTTLTHRWKTRNQLISKDLTRVNSLLFKSKLRKN